MHFKIRFPILGFQKWSIRIAAIALSVGSLKHFNNNVSISSIGL